MAGLTMIESGLWESWDGSYAAERNSVGDWVVTWFPRAAVNSLPGPGQVIARVPTLRSARVVIDQHRP